MFSHKTLKSVSPLVVVVVVVARDAVLPSSVGSGNDDWMRAFHDHVYPVTQLAVTYTEYRWEGEEKILVALSTDLDLNH